MFNIKNKKIVVNTGFAFYEDKIVNKLQDYAKKGYKVEKMYMFFFLLSKTEPLDIQYAIDFPSKITDTDEYLKIYQSAGWSHVCNYRKVIFIFMASKDTKKVYSDSTPLETYRIIGKRHNKLLGNLSLLILYIGLILLYFVNIPKDTKFIFMLMLFITIIPNIIICYCIFKYLKSFKK